MLFLSAYDSQIRGIAYPTPLLFHVSLVRLGYPPTLQGLIDIDCIPTLPEENVAAVHVFSNRFRGKTTYVFQCVAP